MGKILDAAEHFFRDDNWNFERHPDRAVLRLPFSGKNGRWMCFAQERNNQLLFYSVASVNAPEEKRAEIAEFVTRANYGMAIGNFELDYNDGEIRYKTSVDVDDGELSKNLVKPAVYVNCLMMDKYLPGLMAVLYAGVSAKDAVEKVEAGAAEAS